MATGVVVGWNKRTGFIAIKCQDGDYTVAEVLDGWEPNVAETCVSGALTSLGHEELTVVGEGETVEVFIQDCHCSSSSARKLLQQ